MGINVSAIRASYVTARVHDHLANDLRDEDKFAERLVDLNAIKGWPVALPFAKDLPIDTRFWSTVAQSNVQVPVPLEQAKRLRRAFVPLRWASAVVAGETAPRIEVHLHRFGVVAIATIDLAWEAPVPVEEVWRRLADIEKHSLEIKIGASPCSTTVRDASLEVAIGLAAELEAGPCSTTAVSSTRRIVTVIDGKSDDPSREMPPDNSPLHIALHRLAGGNDAIAAPATAFVPQWTQAGYRFPPSRMMYALSAGSANLIETAIRPESGEVRASDWHRERTLMTAYVCALADLVVAAPNSQVGTFQAWARLGAATLGRLYGPAGNYLEWGQYPAAILTRSGAITAVRDALDGKLFSNENFPVGPYPV